MRNQIKAIGDAVSAVSNYVGKLTDPDSVDSDREPSDYTGTAPPLTDREKRIVDLVEDRAREAANDRRPYDGRGMESLAFYNGKQYGYWNAETGRMDDPRDLKNPDRVYGAHNKIRPAATHLIARALAADVAVVFKPRNTLPDNLIATRQMRSIWAHLQEVNDWESLHARMIENTVIVNPCACQVTYDTQAWVEIPQIDPKSDPQNPQITGVEEQQIGEIKFDFLAFDELLIDPKARIRYEADWIIVEKRRSLNYIKGKWKEEGQWVAGEELMTTDESLRDTAILSRTNRSGKSASKTAVVRTMWELPVPGDPDTEKGRYIVTAGGRLLEDKEYLYPEMARKRLFPVAVFPYRNGIETPYGDNALFPAISPQRTYNRGLNKIDEHNKRGDGKLLVEKGSEVDAKAFRSEARDEVIFWTRQDPRYPQLVHEQPHFIELPPLEATVTESIKIADDDIKAILSVNDPTQGLTNGDLSGVALNALQQGDQSEGSLLRTNDSRMVREVAELASILVRQFYLENEARMIFAQDTAPQNAPQPVFTQPSQAGANQPMPQGMGQSAPQGGMPGLPGAPQDNPDPDDSPTMEAMIFSKLSEGRWTIKAVAEASISDNAKQQLFMQLFQAGAFMPQQLPATMVLLREFGLMGSDEMMDDLKQALVIMDQMQQKPQGPPPPDPMQVLQAETEAKTQSEVAKINAQAQANIQVEQAKRAMPPSVSLTGKLDQPGVLAAEEAANLDVHGAATHMATVANLGPLGADIHHQHMPGQPTPGNAPDPVAEAAQQAQIAQGTAEHSAGVEVSKAQALKAMEPAPADPNEELARQKDLTTHQTDEQIRAANAMPAKPTK